MARISGHSAIRRAPSMAQATPGRPSAMSPTAAPSRSPGSGSVIGAATCLSASRCPSPWSWTSCGWPMACTSGGAPSQSWPPCGGGLRSWGPWALRRPCLPAWPCARPPRTRAAALSSACGRASRRRARWRSRSSAANSGSRSTPMAGVWPRPWVTTAPLRATSMVLGACRCTWLRAEQSKPSCWSTAVPSRSLTCPAGPLWRSAPRCPIRMVVGRRTSGSRQALRRRG
mmetsp:Transcript_45639/g.145656  ORF Transcript_45639/g.145656 Transcript_45639/m.145656 type:complete len:229 (+) Transcript_45639:1236-1922(+)